MQVDLLGNQKQKWSCCHCNWEGYLKEGDKKQCPKCEWAIWKIEEAREMTDTYLAFKKKYGE